MTQVQIETNLGAMTIRLHDEKAPVTTGNFLKLADQGYYNGLIFHRVIADFMIQGGCPKGTGMGGPGWTIRDEFHKDLRHDKAGVLSMANAGPDTGGSQFFITLTATPWLDGKHAVFGEVVEGLDVLEKIGATRTGAQDRPVQPVTMSVRRV